MRHETTTPPTTTPETILGSVAPPVETDAAFAETSFGSEPAPLATLGELDEGHGLATFGRDRSRHARTSHTVGDLAGAFGKGLAAGLVGTAVMTLVQTIEMKLNDREASKVPAEAVEKVFGIEPRDEKAEERLSQLVHFAYGTAWGGVLGVLERAGLGRVGAPLAHFGAVWGTAAAMLPALGLAPPPSEWSKQEIATDALHHAVYSAAAGAAYAWLDS